MTYTSHGHHIPGTVMDDEKKPNRHRCGGPGLCSQCSREAERHIWKSDTYPQHRPTIPMNVPDDFPAKAKGILTKHIEGHFSSTGLDTPEFQVYIVWFVKVLQHWKALVCTDRDDEMYYEITYDGDMGQAYLDAYAKRGNYVIPD